MMTMMVVVAAGMGMAAANLAADAGHPLGSTLCHLFPATDLTLCHLFPATKPTLPFSSQLQLAAHQAPKACRQLLLYRLFLACWH